MTSRGRHGFGVARADSISWKASSATSSADSRGRSRSTAWAACVCLVGAIRLEVAKDDPRLFGECLPDLVHRREHVSIRVAEALKGLIQLGQEAGGHFVHQTVAKAADLLVAAFIRMQCPSPLRIAQPIPCPRFA